VWWCAPTRTFYAGVRLEREEKTNITKCKNKCNELQMHPDIPVPRYTSSRIEVRALVIINMRNHLYTSLIFIVQAPWTRQQP
jgi:hypothetical protein